MTRSRSNPFRPLILVTFLVSLAILFSGVRVPDLSGPQRPKASHRIVLKAQNKTCSNYQKQYDDVATVLPKPSATGTTLIYLAVSQVSPPPCSSPLLSTNSGRSPPAQN
jgi:hypothetical protein